MTQETTNNDGETMNTHYAWIGIIIAILCSVTACNSDKILGDQSRIAGTNKGYQENDKYQYAKSLYEQEQYAEALDSFIELGHIYQKNATIFNYIGLCYYHLDNYDHALKNYNRASSLSPFYATPLHNMGVIYLEKNNYETALEYFSKAIACEKEDDPYTGTYILRARVFYYLEQSVNALSDLSTAIELDPTSIHAYASRAGIYRRMGDFNSALNDANTIIQMDDTEIDGYISRAWIYASMDDIDQAIDEFDIVYSHASPSKIPVHKLALVEMLIIFNHYDKAIEQLLSLEQESNLAEKINILINYHHAILAKVQNKDTTPYDQYLNDMATTPITLHWNFHLIEEWLDTVNLPEHTIDYIRDKTEWMQHKFY